jgi:hypothetical protein
MTLFEKILLCLAFIGILLKGFLIDGGTILTSVSLFLLATTYYPFGFFLFNSKKVTFDPQKFFALLKTIPVLRIIGTVGTGIALSAMLSGIIFKLDQLPGGSMLLIVGLILSIPVFGTIIYKLSRKSDPKFYKGILVRLIIVSTIGIFLYLTPGVVLVSFFHRDNPEYVNAYKKASENPDNIELWQKARELK